MKHNGWLKLHRKLLESSVWEQLEPEHLKVFFGILLSVNTESKTWIFDGKSYTCEPGELITSRAKLAELCKVTEANVRTSIKNLQLLEILTVKSTSQSTKSDKSIILSVAPEPPATQRCGRPLTKLTFAAV